MIDRVVELKRFVGRGLAVSIFVIAGCAPSEQPRPGRIGYIGPDQGSEAVDILRSGEFSIARGTLYNKDWVNSFVLIGQEGKALDYVLANCRVLKEHTETLNNRFNTKVVDVAAVTCLPRLAGE